MSVATDSSLAPSASRWRRSRKSVFGPQVLIFLALVGCTLLYKKAFPTSLETTNRRELQDNCTFSFIPDLKSFDQDSIKGQALCDDEENYIYLTVVLMIYTFWALAIVVDERFIPALEEFVDRWELSNEVAGATLMAAGGSAPEFFTNLFSSVNETATGFGTIVGSAVFNVLFVIGAVAWFTKEDLELEWWILFRDSSYYSFSIIVLAYFYYCGNNESSYECKEDGVMTVYESAILFALYCGYCFLLIFKVGGVPLHRILKRKIVRCRPGIVPQHQRLKALRSVADARGLIDHEELNRLEAEASAASEAENKRRSRKSMRLELENSQGDFEEIEFPLRPKQVCYTDSKGDAGCVPLRKLLNPFVWFISLPIVLPLAIVPKVSDEVWQSGAGKNFRLLAALFGFFMSLVFIAFFTGIMVYAAETFGKTLGIDELIMGYTILAAGTSAPDLLSSVFVALKGEGGMAVSSSIGSNIFDITVGLPIPWLISTGIGNVVEIQASSILVSLGTLFLMLVSVVVVTMQQGWKLTKPLAMAMMVLYFVFLVIVIVPDL
mmetsp:Transcript_4404/g.5108  ORF Transcript_4404/g.5108 Transcript_4404/m.5108 type:complete len:550 (+) Transcript_4404:267-1916(+)|eukprot:CAMPEP_0184019746 /NCGR_PEP_ID=MMETSP0954-20121128/8937_1 /TAXON_ID=627963 /ORGANISM="Aplanochytrium sp, Strain PBS07" /LENGTH=549 /DNA_ID=CAMNT_0026301475 /DNA_START=171 /DNA_END=1820 /DNA_ORIENTATION=+